MKENRRNGHDWKFSMPMCFCLNSIKLVTHTCRDRSDPIRFDQAQHYSSTKMFVSSQKLVAAFAVDVYCPIKIILIHPCAIVRSTLYFSSFFLFLLQFLCIHFYFFFHIFFRLLLCQFFFALVNVCFCHLLFAIFNAFKL